MKRLGIFIAALAAAVLWSGGAMAQVSYRPSGDAWTGFYIGGNLGMGLSRVDWTDNFTGKHVGVDKKLRLIGGGQLGADYRFAERWVIGIQAMFDWADTETDGPNEITCNSCGLRDLMRTGPIAAVNGRIGYLVQPAALFYLKGGAAWANYHYRLFEPTPGPGVFANVKDMLTGYTVGGGLEYMIAPRWSVFADYTRIDFGSHTWPVSPSSIETKQIFQTFVLGVNYRFNSGL